MASITEDSCSQGEAHQLPNPAVEKDDAPAISATEGVVLSNQEEILMKTISPLGKLVTIRLEDDNYLLWKFQTENAILGYGLEGYIYGNQQIPARTITNDSGVLIPNPSYIVYQRQDKLLVSWLLASISPSYLPQLIGCTSSREIWITIAQQFSSQSTAKIMYYKKQIQNLKKEGLSMKDYLTKMKSLSDLLEAAGHKVSETDHILAILNGLGDEYESIIAIISSQEIPHSLRTVRTLLLSHEGRINQKFTTGLPAEMSANFTTQKKIFGGNHGNYQGSYSGKGVFQNNSRGGFAGNKTKGRGGRWSNNSRPQCQLCGKLGHTVQKCYYRFDISFTGLNNAESKTGQTTRNFSSQSSANIVQEGEEYSQDHNNMSAMAATPDIVNNSSWYPDSGATNHVTCDLNNLSYGSLYHGSNNQPSSS